MVMVSTYLNSEFVNRILYYHRRLYAMSLFEIRIAINVMQYMTQLLFMPEIIYYIVIAIGMCGFANNENIKILLAEICERKTYYCR